MCAELFDEDGQKVEAFTPEEVDSKIEEATQKAIDETTANRQEEMDELTGRMEEIEKEKGDISEKFEKEKEKEKNFEGLRKLKGDKEKIIGELNLKLDESKKEISEKLEEIGQKTQQESVNRSIDELSGEDKELKEKIKTHYDSFQGVPADEDERKTRLNNAYLLATGRRPDTPLPTAAISGVGGEKPSIKGGEKLSEGAQDVGKRLGITDQEFKKHGLL